ncbi:MAG: helix-turn-helix transcriptional regulator [Gemmatimonadota bacterium]|jgi:transcriptional regulator with XRE-family HTH domain
MVTFGRFVRDCREALRKEDPRYSVRRVAQRMGIQPSYLSKVERDEVPPPSEETTKKLAQELGVDSDVLLAMAGRVSSDLQDVIRKRPALFAELIRGLKEMPDHAVLRIVREVRDGEW